MLSMIIDGKGHRYPRSIRCREPRDGAGRGAGTRAHARTSRRLGQHPRDASVLRALSGAKMSRLGTANGQDGRLSFAEQQVVHTARGDLCPPHA